MASFYINRFLWEESWQYTYQYVVYKKCHIYFQQLWCTLSSPSPMHDLDPACAHWGTKKKKTGQHIVQPLGTDIAVCQVMQVNVCTNICKNCILQPECAYTIRCPPTCRILISRWNTLKRVLSRYILQIEVSQTWPLSLSLSALSSYLKKKKKNLKVKQESQDLWKQKKCVASRLTQCWMGKNERTDLKAGNLL